MSSIFFFAGDIMLRSMSRWCWLITKHYSINHQPWLTVNESTGSWWKAGVPSNAAAIQVLHQVQRWLFESCHGKQHLGQLSSLWIITTRYRNTYWPTSKTYLIAGCFWCFCQLHSLRVEIRSQQAEAASDTAAPRKEGPGCLRVGHFGNVPTCLTWPSF